MLSEKMATQRNEALLNRLQELQDLYDKLQKDETDVAPIQNKDSVSNVWSDLYQPYMQWIKWNFLVPSKVWPIVNFNVAVDVHKALYGNTGYEMSEPVLAWLPQLLNSGNGEVDSKHYTQEEMDDAHPMWDDARLKSFLEKQPVQLLLEKHATPRGLLGGQRPRCIQPYCLSTLVKGSGWAPTPPPNFYQSLQMIVHKQPLNVSTLFF